MDPVAMLRAQSEKAQGWLREACEGVPQELAWATVAETEFDYLNTGGSILGVVAHVASCKLMYASAGFRGGELRWKRVAERFDSIHPDWADHLAYLDESHGYWVSAWEGLDSSALEGKVTSIRGDERRAIDVIEMMLLHDSYHAGQIALLRATISPTDSPPPGYGDDIREYCRESPFW